MKNKTYQIGVVTLSLIMMLAASCGRQEDSVESTTAKENVAVAVTTAAESTSASIADVSIAPGETDSEFPDDDASVLLHGIVCQTGETLLVHPEPWLVLNPANVDPADCYEIPLSEVTVRQSLLPDSTVEIEDIQIGDFVEVRHSETMASSNRPKEIYGVVLCGNVVNQMSVTEVQVNLNRILLGDIALSRSVFDEGLVWDTSGNAVSFEEVSVGDLFEVQHRGEFLASCPGWFGHLHVIRRIKTAAQLKAEAAAQAVLEALNKAYTLRGTVRVFDNGSKLVWLGETTVPEEIDYFSCTSVGGSDCAVTDAATGQILTWDDLADGDYVAVTGSGGIAETGPMKWPGVMSITRLARLCHEGTVSAVASDGITVMLEDGTTRRVTVTQYYVSGVRFDISTLQIGDTVRLDVNAHDETEVYALHLLSREVQIPEEAVTETFRVSIVSGTRVYLVRDLNYDASYHRFDEQGAVIYEGETSFDVDRIFYDADGSVRSAKIIRGGDLVTVIYSGILTETEPSEFVSVYKIMRVTE